MYRICPIRIEIIYGRGKFVGDFDMGNIISNIVESGIKHHKNQPITSLL
jgi:hypothetical protein